MTVIIRSVPVTGVRGYPKAALKMMLNTGIAVPARLRLRVGVVVPEMLIANLIWTEAANVRACMIRPVIWLKYLSEKTWIIMDGEVSMPICTITIIVTGIVESLAAWRWMEF
jgi:hypothetical protein